MTTRRTVHRTRIRRRRLAAALVVVVALAAALGGGLPATPSPTASATDTATTIAAPPSAAPPRARAHDAAELDPDLDAALGRARQDAAADGVAIRVTSGRRSPEHQQQLLDEAVSRYGSYAEASRWVARPERSLHVSGDAVDVGPDAAAAWLADHGAAYGLCRVYRNEPWHFELRPDAPARGCPPPYPDPTHDPRLQP